MRYKSFIVLWKAFFNVFNISLFLKEYRWKEIIICRFSAGKKMRLFWFQLSPYFDFSFPFKYEETINLFQMDIDAIFKEIGELGPQQRIYGGCMCLMNGYAAFHMLQVLYCCFVIPPCLCVWFVVCFRQFCSRLYLPWYPRAEFK